MSTADEALLEAFDGHEVERVRAALAAGADPSRPIRGKLATDWLLEQYWRSDQLADCLRHLLEHGATFRDPCLAPIVLNDSAAIRQAAQQDSTWLTRRTSLRSAFTSLEDVTWLHVAAEYGHLAAVETLLSLGADVNARAGCDAAGLNGHTPIFHAVNSLFNWSAPVMQRLLDAGARTDVLLHGLHWGQGYEWHTVFFDVTPVSYAQLGLMPQMHRKELHVAENVTALLRAAHRTVPPLENIPNRYLRASS